MSYVHVSKSIVDGLAKTAGVGLLANVARLGAGRITKRMARVGAKKAGKAIGKDIAILGAWDLGIRGVEKAVKKPKANQ